MVKREGSHRVSGKYLLLFSCATIFMAIESFR